MNCSRCNDPIGSISIGDDAGPSHPRCYHLAHPYVPKQTLREVLNNGDDRVLARQLVEEYMPLDRQRLLIAEFNAIMQARYQSRIKED